MSVYTVHEPPLKRYESEPNPDRFVFVRDGFAFWAFLLTPLWMLRHRLWLVLLLYVVAVTVLEVAMWRLGAAGVVNFAVGVLLSLLIGFEAATLRRWTLARRGWRQAGVVVADELETAERRFFDAWVKDHATPASPPAAAPPPASPRMPPAQPDVVGLFPEPGASR